MPLSNKVFSIEDLSKWKINELRTRIEHLKEAVRDASEEVIRLLLSRDRRQRRVECNFEKMTNILKQAARDIGLSSELKFSFHPHESYHQWLQSWLVLAYTSQGIPKIWRNRVWSVLAHHSTNATSKQDQSLDNETLKETITKRASQYGNEGNKISRVLISYAMNNDSCYYQEYMAITATIVKVVGEDETLAVKVLSCLLDHKIPKGYYSDHLSFLSTDMSVLRTLLSYLLPDIAAHLDHLRISSASSQLAYSFTSPPLKNPGNCYEPPLMDAFSIRWLPVILVNILPRKAARRVIDAILLEGSEMVLFACLAVWAVLEVEILSVRTTSEFYSTMSELLEKLRLSQLLSSSDFIKVMYTLRTVARRSDLPSVSQLRMSKTQPGYKPLRTISCPLPSQGGGLYLHSRQTQSNMSTGVTLKLTSAPTSPGGHIQLKKSVRVSAQAICPQSGAQGNTFAFAYAADVPIEVVQHYQQVEDEQKKRMLQKHGKRFILSTNFNTNRL